MLQKNIKLIQLCWGPLAFIVFTWLLEGSFGFKGAAAIGTTIWMGLWWIMRPVDIAVTSLLPIGINAIFNLVPSGLVISQYFSEIVVLLIGSDIISLTWTKTGLDKRLAIKALCFIGPSIASADNCMACCRYSAFSNTAQCCCGYDPLSHCCINA